MATKTKKEKGRLTPLAPDDNQAVSAWNPLRYLTAEQVAMMLDAARSGRISQLQVMYSWVEADDLTLAMCINRRSSALPDWTIKRRDTRRYRSYDEHLAGEQEAYLYDQFVRCEDSGTLLKAIDTLHMSVFRGLGVVEPIYDAYGLERIVSLDPWNFAVDFSRHDDLGNHPLYWNPSGADTLDFQNHLERIPEDEVVAAFSPSPIDSFGLQIYLATQMGFESYCKLVARKGLPATYVIAPEDLPQENLQTWAERAVQCARGGSGAFPFGSNVITQAIDPGNAQSIQDFLEYMSKQIVLASTGGTLTSLAQPTGMGSNVADVQQDVFKTIVRHDAYRIGDLINRGIAKKLLNEQFPGRPHLVYFDLANEDKQNPEKYLADAVSAKNAGLVIDVHQLEELTGYKLSKEAPAGGDLWSVPRLPNDDHDDHDDPPQVENADPEPSEPAEPAEPPPEAAGLQGASDGVDGKKHGLAILKAFDGLLAPLRGLVKKLLSATGKEEAESAMADIRDEVARLEADGANDDNELEKAVEALLAEGFEAAAETPEPPETPEKDSTPKRKEEDGQP